MERIQSILKASVLGRLLISLSAWFGVQWQESGIITAFLTPSPDRSAMVKSSIFFRLSHGLRQKLSAFYAKHKLDRLFEGSIFTRSGFWGILAVALAPLIPTMALLGLSLICLFSVCLNLIRKPDQLVAQSPINRYILLYAAVYLASTFLSVSLWDSLPVGALTVAFTIFAITLQNAITSQKMLDRLIAGLLLSATVVAFIGFYQFIFQAGYQSEAWVDSDMFASISFRVPSTLDNPNMLGQFLILTIPFAVANLLRSKTKRQRQIYLVCCFALVLCIVLTFSRGAWLGLLFAAAIFALLLNPRLMFLAPVALIALYFLLPETIIERFTSIGDLTDASTSYRVFIWLGVIAMLKDFWFCGIGPGEVAFNMVYPKYSYSSIVAPHSHNLFLQVITDTGICGLVLFCIILFSYFRTLGIAIRRKDSWDSRILQIASCSAIAGFMVQAMTDYSFYNYRVMFLFWAVLAIGALSAKRESLPKEATP